MNAQHAVEELKLIADFMRTYLVLRLYRLTLLLGTSGAIITALVSDNVRQRGFTVILLLKIAALMISAAFAVMDFSAAAPWTRLRQRANELAPIVGYHLFPTPSRWSPFTATGASNYLHVVIVLLWGATLLVTPR